MVSPDFTVASLYGITRLCQNEALRKDFSVLHGSVVGQWYVGSIITLIIASAWAGTVFYSNCMPIIWEKNSGIKIFILWSNHLTVTICIVYIPFNVLHRLQSSYTILNYKTNGLFPWQHYLVPKSHQYQTSNDDIMHKELNMKQNIIYEICGTQNISVLIFLYWCND